MKLEVFPALAAALVLNLATALSSEPFLRVQFIPEKLVAFLQQDDFETFPIDPDWEMNATDPVTVNFGKYDVTISGAG